MAYQVNFGQQQAQQYAQYGHCHPQAPPPQNSQVYGAYGQQIHNNVYQQQAWQAMQFQSEDEFQYIFDQNKSQRYNAIQAEELCRILNTNERLKNYYRINWSLELCKIMIAMLDRSKDGMMQYPEFRELLQCLVYWYTTFCQYDVNRSGYIEAHELNNCISQKFQYRLSAKALEQILKRYGRAMDDGKILVAFDDFVSCSVRLRAYTEAFRARDRMHNQGQETGSTGFSYDDFIQCTMCL